MVEQGATLIKNESRKREGAVGKRGPGKKASSRAIQVEHNL